MTTNKTGRRNDRLDIKTDIRTDQSAQAFYPDDPILEARDLAVSYGDDRALQSTTVELPEKQVTAIIGPSGCGKSTFLRCINRMNDLVDSARVEGQLLFEGKNVYDDDVDPVALRRRIGMVFQNPTPSPNRSEITSPTDSKSRARRPPTRRSNRRSDGRRCGRR
jgi:ABC-type polar amino acid transport system ATPase subunit